jgi:quercetin dioxygenase-like cupin family protein
MQKISIAATATSLLLALSVSAQKLQAPEARVVPLQPLTKDFEVIFGNPDAPGESFVMRIRELPGTVIPPHSHPVDEHITVLEGTFFFAVSEKFDRSLLKELKAGSYAFAPKGSTMFGGSPDGAIVQVHGVGPFHIHWRDGFKTLDDPDAAQVFRFRKGDRVTASRGAGTIRQGYASGAVIQYEIERSNETLFMADEAETRRKQKGR